MRMEYGLAMAFIHFYTLFSLGNSIICCCSSGFSFLLFFYNKFDLDLVLLFYFPPFSPFVCRHGPVQLHHSSAKIPEVYKNSIDNPQTKIIEGRWNEWRREEKLPKINQKKIKNEG
jgi:hypothetical protein